MKNSRAAIEDRQQSILQELRQDERVSVQELAARLGASPLTIRRDLGSLEKQGLLSRHYGGATLLGDQPPKDFLQACREAIARTAARYVADGDTIFINSSSSALMLLNYVTAKGVTVITNNGKVLQFDLPADMTVVLTGGELRYPKGSMTGDFAVNNLGRVTAVKAFLGCSGLTAEEGFTTASMQEVAINQAMLARVTGSKFILADHTRIGKRHSFISGAPEQISCVITDAEADPQVLEALKAKNIRIVQAT
jgi:DeoR/GlpR family transcriptional regulator of sugar metabolism